MSQPSRPLDCGIFINEARFSTKIMVHGEKGFNKNIIKHKFIQRIKKSTRTNKRDILKQTKALIPHFNEVIINIKFS